MPEMTMTDTYIEHTNTGKKKIEVEKTVFIPQELWDEIKLAEKENRPFVVTPDTPIEIVAIQQREISNGV